MTRCWSCGSQVSGGLRYLFTCPSCDQVQKTKELSQVTAKGFADLARAQEVAFESLSQNIAELASIVEWGFSEVVWQLQEQTGILRDIAHTLKTPRETQAEELRQMAEQLRIRGMFDESVKRFVEAMGLNPLDYRIYAGLAHTYLKMGKFDEAKTFLENSLPHAPTERRRKPLLLSKRELDKLKDTQTRLRASRELKRLIKGTKLVKDEELVSLAESVDRYYFHFDYRSYSYRLIARVCMCEEAYGKAVEAARQAVTLTPDYPEAHYDYSQYCARLGDKEQCISSLHKAISDRPFYLHMAQRESNFEPLRHDVQDELNLLARTASDKAKATLDKSALALREFQEAYSLAYKSIDMKKQKLLRESGVGYVGDECHHDYSLHPLNIKQLQGITTKRLDLAIATLQLNNYPKILQVNKEWESCPALVRNASSWFDKVHRLSTEIQPRLFRSPKVPTWWGQQHDDEAKTAFLEWKFWIEDWANRPDDESETSWGEEDETPFGLSRRAQRKSSMRNSIHEHDDYDDDDDDES